MNAKRTQTGKYSLFYLSVLFLLQACQNNSSAPSTRPHGPRDPEPSTHRLQILDCLEENLAFLKNQIIDETDFWNRLETSYEKCHANKSHFSVYIQKVINQHQQQESL